MMACRAVVSPRHHLPTRLGQEPLLLLAPARQAQRATASNRRRVLRCSATAAPPEHATAVETPQEVATPAKMVRVPNPVQLLTDGQLPMTSMEVTTPGSCEYMTSQSLLLYFLLLSLFLLPSRSSVPILHCHHLWANPPCFPLHCR